MNLKTWHFFLIAILAAGAGFAVFQLVSAEGATAAETVAQRLRKICAATSWWASQGPTTHWAAWTVRSFQPVTLMVRPYWLTSGRPGAHLAGKRCPC